MPLTKKAQALLKKKGAPKAAPKAVELPAPVPAPTAKVDINKQGGATYAGVAIKAVYMNHNSNVAVVVGIGKTKVHFLHMMDGNVDLDSMGQDTFLDRFSKVMPNYPITRACRTMRDSTLAKTEKAARAIRIVIDE